MKPITDYDKVFETLVRKTQDYIVGNNLNCMVLGISGGIDSTVVAAICHEVSERTNIPLIGISLPTKFNKEEEIITADIVGKAFCSDYEKISIMYPYDAFIDFLEAAGDSTTPISKGNIQARLRMMYLYNLASIYKGIVMDTDNLTENNLGYFTIHGDVGDFNPIGGLWKTEVFKLAEYLHEHYSRESHLNETYPDQLKPNSDYSRCIAVAESLKLKPTAGLGITNNDLEEIGAESYEQVDYILQEILAWKWLSSERGETYDSVWDMRHAFLEEQQMFDTPIEVIIAVTDRHFKSEFKRKQLPIKITRDEIL
jgi:NAD+ synthetase